MESCGGLYPSAEIWFKSTFRTINYIQVYFRRRGWGLGITTALNDVHHVLNEAAKIAY